jgi:uncharacterized protein
MSMSFYSLRPHVETLAAALAGIILFMSLGLPTPTLSGAMVGVAVLIAFGRTAAISGYLRDFGMLISGMAMGAAVTPEMLQGFQRYPLSLFMLFIILSLGMFLSYLFLRIVGRWDRDTAFFSCVPGALTVVLSMAAGSKANLAKVSIAQSFRLFILFAVLPSLVTLQGAGAILPAKAVLGPLPFALTLGGGVVLAFILKQFNFAAPWVFGGMFISASLHGSGVITGDAHPTLTQVGFGLVGAFIGTRFAGIAREQFFNLLMVSFGSIIIGLVVTVVGAVLAERLLTGVTFGQAVVAFAPGAIEGMIILGAALGLDPIYVGLHHLVRFIGIGFALPFGYAVFKDDKKEHSDHS